MQVLIIVASVGHRVRVHPHIDFSHDIDGVLIQDDVIKPEWIEHILKESKVIGFHWGAWEDLVEATVRNVRRASLSYEQWSIPGHSVEVTILFSRANTLNKLSPVHVQPRSWVDIQRGLR